MVKHLFRVVAGLALACGSVNASDIVWSDDAPPAGAWTGSDSGDAWKWVTANPLPYSGAKAHQSAPVAGVHYHYFSGATTPLALNSGDTLFTYIYLDPANPPREVMMQWFDGASWSHAAYWGENLIPWGVNGSASQFPAGPLPATGTWVRLEVPASSLALEGRAISGLQYILYNGRATWDASGKASAPPAVSPAPVPIPTPVVTTPPITTPATNTPPAVSPAGSTSTPTLPSWVGATTHNWKAKLGGVYWLDSRAVVKQAAPFLNQSPRPVLVDIKSDAIGYGYRFDLNSWDPQSTIHTYYSWNGTDAGMPASPEDVFNILGATGNAEFILNIPIPKNLTGTPTSNWGFDGSGYLWQTAEFYAAMAQYFFGAAGPASEWQSLPASLDFFSQPASFNWADLRARRGHPNPYPVNAVIIGEEPYNLEGTPTGASYGPQAEKFRVAIRNRGVTVPLGLHVRDMGIVDDPNGGWFYPMMSSLNASDFSYIDLEHYYQFSTVPETFKRVFPVSINPKGFQGWWLPTSQWKSDYSKFLWIEEDTRHAIQDDGAVAGLGDPSRWKLGFSEHGVQIATQFMYNDMFSAMHWAGWLAESMRQNIVWDSGWTLLAEGFSTAALQNINGQVTRTPMFYVYQMAQEFYGFDYLANSYASAMGSATDGQGNPVQFPWNTVRVFRDPATGQIHLFVVNQSPDTAATLTGFENWNVVSWRQLSSHNYADSNPLGVATAEPIQTVAVSAQPGAPLSIPPISVNHIVLAAPAAPNNDNVSSVALSTGESIVLSGNTVESSVGPAGANTVQISWKSAAGTNYRVAYKNSLTDGAWTALSPTINAVSTTASFIDSTATGVGSRYYVVYVGN